MSKSNNKWQQRGFNDKYEYAGWLHFNDLTDDSKMHDDVYYDPYTGQVINVIESPRDESFDDNSSVEEED